MPVSEFQLTSETIRKFRLGYMAAFGAATRDDLLYEAVSEGRRYPGMEHWLPLFHDHMDTLFDYLDRTPVVLEPLADDVAHERITQIVDYYDARKNVPEGAGGVPYKPLPPERLYFTEDEWRAQLARVKLARMTPFAVPEADNAAIVDIGTKQGHNFSAERAEADANVFDAVVKHVAALQRGGKHVVMALWSEGARDRMSHVLRDHGLANLVNVASWQDALARPVTEVAFAVLGLESGFETAQAAVDRRAGYSRRPAGAAAPRLEESREFHRRGHQPVGRRSGGPCRSRHRPLHRSADHRSRGRAA